MSLFNSNLIGRPMSRTLPLAATAMLADAAATDPFAPPGESRARTVAVNRAIQRVRLMYPQFFTHEKE